MAAGDLEVEPSTSAGGRNLGSRTRTTGEFKLGPISTFFSSLAPESSWNNKEKKAFSFDIFFFFFGGRVAS